MNIFLTKRLIGDIHATQDSMMMFSLLRLEAPPPLSRNSLNPRLDFKDRKIVDVNLEFSFDLSLRFFLLFSNEKKVPHQIQDTEPSLERVLRVPRSRARGDFDESASALGF